MKARRFVAAFVVALCAFGVMSAAESADPRGAERQYKIARRLLAERSLDAATALVKVFELDPEGPLADDASVESALLVGIARWPEELGDTLIEDAGRARLFLERVTVGLPNSDRATEARFYRALQLLEPNPGRDVSAARLTLLELSDSAVDGEWSSRARYTRAWIDEHDGRVDSASAAFQRLAIDAADPAIVARSRAGLGRIALREGRYGEAASRFDDAARVGLPDRLAASPLRELAVRVLLMSVPGETGEPEIVAAGTGIRSIGGWVGMPNGEVAMADRRNGEVHRYRSNGSVASRWSVPGLQALGADPLGRLYAAAAGAVFRLEPGLAPRNVTNVGDFGVVSALAADAVGRLYLLDKRGGAIATVTPGAAGERRESYAAKLSGLVWDGDRLLALDARGKRVVALGSGGAVRTVVDGFEKPEALAVDRAGRLAVVDSRTGNVSFFDSNGGSLGSWSGPRCRGSSSRCARVRSRRHLADVRRGERDLGEVAVMRRSIIVVVVALAGLGLAFGIQSEGRDSSGSDETRDLLDAVREDLVELRFESALAGLEALLGRPGMSSVERGEALVLRAQTHVASGDLDAAEQDYREILGLRAAYVPESSLIPKKAMTRFEKVRAEMVGSLIVELSPPDARLSVDGRPVSPEASGTLVILAGEFDLRAEREGYDPAEQHVIVVAGSELPIQFDLVPNARTLILETEPADVEVWLDGELAGETARAEDLANLPATLVLENLPLGDHRIELRKPCFRTERFDEFLTVDLLDQSPRRLNLVRMMPARATLSLEGGPDGAEVEVDGIEIGRLPIDPYAVCPGKRSVEVRFARRILWRVEPELRESTEVVLTVAPRPNVVLLGADEWPAGLSEFGDAFNTLETGRFPRGGDPEEIDDWRRIEFPAGTDLAVAVVRASRSGARDRWYVYSPILRASAVMEVAPTVAVRPAWTTVVWGIETVDSTRLGNALVVTLANVRGPEGLEVGDRIVSVDGAAVADSAAFRRRLAAARDSRRAKIEWREPSGETGEGILSGAVSPQLQLGRSDATQDVLRAAWAVVDAASTGDRSPTALANLALLLSQYGHHKLSAETWQRVRWGDRSGVGDGTRQYYLGTELLRLGREDEAIAAFARAAESASTAFDDDGFRVAPAARDRLADLGVRPD